MTRKQIADALNKRRREVQTAAAEHDRLVERAQAELDKATLAHEAARHARAEAISAVGNVADALERQLRTSLTSAERAMIGDFEHTIRVAQRAVERDAETAGTPDMTPRGVSPGSVAERAAARERRSARYLQLLR